MSTHRQKPANDALRWNLLQRKAQEARIVSAFEIFRQRGFEPVLIKGYAAGVYYPPLEPRLSIDIDLAVSPDSFAAAQELATSSETTGLAIDLHNGLRHLDSVPWDDLFANTRALDVDGYSIRVLRPEDHLRVICVHWLTNGGSEKDRLWDVYYLLENRSADFDWDRFLKVVGERRRRWLVCTVGLASRYLGLDLSGTPIEEEARNIPQWLIKAVEREWHAESRLYPLELSIQDRKTLPREILRRLRPDPIWSTINMEGSFDARTRAFYQIASNLKRIPPSLRRITRVITRKLAQ